MAEVTISHDVDKSDLKAEYTTGIAKLTLIRDAPSMTQAEAIQAIQYMASILLFILKVVRKLI